MPSPFTANFQALPPEAIEKWHSQDDVDDPPFKRPLRAMMAHHAAVDRAAELVGEVRNLRWGLVVTGVLTVASLLGSFVSLFLITGVVVGLAFSFFLARGLQLARAEEARVKKEITAQHAMAQNLVMEADRKIVDLGPPPDEV